MVRVAHPEVRLKIYVNGEEVELPLRGKASLELENRDSKPVVLSVRYKGGQWGPLPLVVKVEVNGKTVYLGRNTVPGASWQVRFEPRQSATLKFTAIAPPRAAQAYPPTVELELHYTPLAVSSAAVSRAAGAAPR